MTIISTPKRPGKSAGPQPAPVTGQQTTGKGKTRAERKVENQIKRKLSEVKELADTAIPARFRAPASAAPVGLPGMGQENQPALPLRPVTGLQTVEERRKEQQKERDAIRGTGVLPAHRPSEYTDAEADILCAWVQAGGSLRKYSESTGRKPETVYRWMRERADFQARYAQAHEDRADTMTDEMLEIADDAAHGASIEGVAAAKLRVETRKWIASKLRPQKWGDKQVVEHVGAVNIRIGIPAKPPATALEMVEEVPRQLAE